MFCAEVSFTISRYLYLLGKMWPYRWKKGRAYEHHLWCQKPTVWLPVNGPIRGRSLGKGRPVIGPNSTEQYNMTQTPLVEYMYCMCTVIIPDFCDVLHWGGCSTKKCVDMWLPPHNGVCYSNFPMWIGGRFWKNVVQKENRKKKKKTSTSKYESYFTVQSTCLELIIQNLKISWGCHPSRMMEKPKTLQ